MKFPESWLRDFVAAPLAGEALAHALTMAGLESEELSAAAPPFEKVVVARVLSLQKHPDADRLNVCQVDVGEGVQRQIVCGAPNVAAGMTVACALPDAILPGNFKIKVAKVRGIESSGMLCSAKELGLAEDADGLMPLSDALRPGLDLRSALSLDDMLHVLKLTPNRGDCLSILGLAREVAAITSSVLKPVSTAEVAVTAKESRQIFLDAPQACPRYLGRVISGVDAKAATPDWMRTRLERCGLRSISALVDITNYVMLELGQPLHAFDNRKLTGAIHVRLAKPGEALKLLNGETLSMAPDVLVIADEKQVLAMAGIMGGEGSGITLETGDVFLESAFFAPHAVAGRARRYGFGSDASHRFERGVDFEGARRALERASQLVLQICGGQAAPIVAAESALPGRPAVTLRLARLAKVLGISLSPEAVLGYFHRLGLPARQEAEAVVVQPPSYRFDLEIEEDLIEEIARLHGYDNIPVAPPKARLSMLPQGEAQRSRASLRNALVASGYQETINFAFVDEAWERDFAANPAAIRLTNPIASQMSVMRSTLVGGLVDNLCTNQRRKQTRVRLFEFGRCFHRNERGTPVAGFSQPWMVGMLAWGPEMPEQWGESARRVDFFDVKGDIEDLFAGHEVEFKSTKHPALHPGRSAAVHVDGQPCGVVGELHPRWVLKFDLASAPVLAEFALEPLSIQSVPRFVDLSQQPAVIRDLALVVDRSLESGQLLEAMKRSQPALVRDIQLFDLYAGKGIEQGQKSLAFRIVMQDTQKTLQDAEVDAALQAWVSELEKSVGAKLRA